MHFAGNLEASMATLTIKNVPDDLYQELKRRADENRRSLNGEVIYSLEQLVQGGRARRRPTVADFRALREQYPIPPMSEEEFERAVTEGRP
jgi:antitoxin FitA